MATQELATGGAPVGLPDVATLARLAGEFFAALPGTPSFGNVPGAVPGAVPVTGSPSAVTSLPAAGSIPSAGGVPVPANVLPAGLSLPPGAAGPSTPSAVPGGLLPPGANLVPSSPQAPANALASAPALVPHAVAGNGVPDHLLSAAPGYDGRFGSQLLGVPPSFGSVPRLPLAPAPVPTPTSPTAFYFLSGPPDAPATTQHYFIDQPPQTAPEAHPAFDVNAVRRDFPILNERVNGRQLVWFDNAATTQKPQVVIDRLAHFYAHENSNIHRAAHELAARATDAYEGARETVRRFIGAGSVDEVIFVRGTTEGINLIAKSWGGKHIGPGDEIIVSHLEHHANIVPWQQLAAEKGAKIRVIPVDDRGQVLLDEYQRLLNDRTKIVSVTQVSNALGTVVPVAKIIELAHRAGALALVDAAQSVSHLRTDVRALDADFLVFSGHKVFGPTGIGAVYGKAAVLDDMPPWQGGGNMIQDVTFERTVYHAPPTRFEAGTGNIADAVGLAAALEYVERIGIEAIGRYEHALLDHATKRMQVIPGLRLIGTAPDKASVLSFVLDGYTTDEVGKALNEEGIAVRTGHHCAQPILRRFGLESTVRPSLAFYNTCEEVDRMAAVVRQLSQRSRRG